MPNPKLTIKSHIFLNAASISSFPRMGGDIVKYGDGVAHYTGKYLGKNSEIVYGNPGDYIVTYEDDSKEIVSAKTFEALTEKSAQIVVQHIDPAKVKKDKPKIGEEENGESISNGRSTESLTGLSSEGNTTNPESTIDKPEGGLEGGTTQEDATIEKPNLGTTGKSRRSS